MNTKKIIFALLIVVPLIIGTTICYILLNKLNYPTNTNEPSVSFNIQEKDYIQLLFVGDLMFDRGIRYYASQNGGNEFIFDKISPTLLSNDLVVANLEGPITDNKSISAGTAVGSADNYFFTFDPSLAKTLFQKNIRLVNLGNNHILNFGKTGLASTEKYLDKANVDYFGAPDYPKSITSKIGGVRITFINYNEFSGLDDSIEQLSTIKEIQRVKEYSDITIIFCHWGAEYALNQTDTQKDIAHQFINVGADLIIGSHPHVVQPMENHNGPDGQSKRIYYSLGNFIFDQYFDEDVRNGLGVVVKINKETKQMEFKELKFYLDDNGQTVLK